MAVCAFGKISLKGLFPARWSFGTELYARLSYFASGHTQTLFVAMDTSCTQPRETDRFRAMVFEQTGIPAGHIWYHELQIHAAPESDVLLGECMDGIARAVSGEVLRLKEQALPFTCEVTELDLGRDYSMNRQQYVAGLGGVTIWTGMGYDEHHNPCSQQPNVMLLRGYQPELPVFDQPVPFDNPVDSKAYLFVFRNEQGGVIGTLSRFAAHPDVAVLFEHHPIPQDVLRRQYHYDYDWPGTLSDQLEEAFGAPSMYLNGPCADLTTKKGFGGDLGTYEGSARECRRIGRELADALLAGYARKRVPMACADDLEAIEFTVELPIQEGLPRSLKELEAWDQKTASAEQALQKAIAEGAPAYRVKQLIDDRWRTGHIPYLVQTLMNFTEEQLQRGSCPVTVSAMKLGGYLFIGVPGECLCEMGIWLRSAFTGVKTIPVDQVNGYYNYMVNPTWLTLGGYTYWASWISREAMPILQKAIIEKIGAFLEE